MSAASAVGRVAVALVVLHLALTMYYWLPEPTASAFVSPSLDLLGVLVLLVTWAGLRDGSFGQTRAGAAIAAMLARIARKLRREPMAAASRVRLVSLADRAFTLVLVVALVLFTVLGFAQGFARREFGYDLVLTLHIPYVPELFRMLYDHEPLGMFLVYIGIALTAVVVGVLGLYAAVRALRSAARGHPGRRALIVFALAYGLFLAPVAGLRAPLAVEAYQQAQLALDLDAQLAVTARRMDAEIAKIRRPNPFPRSDDRPSIYNFVIESYGAIVFHDERIERWSASEYDALLAALEDAGYTVRTGYLDAPVFGGSSWMAQHSLLCGAWIDSQERFESSFLIKAPCLPELLNAAGYRTVIAAANTTFQEDRYERKFPFDAYYFRDDFGYRGMRYGWSFVPDQFVIHVIDKREVKPHAGAPIFVHYQLTTSHHPWNMIPPYIEDWDLSGDGSREFVADGTTFENRFISGRHYKRGYWGTIEYSLRTIAGYAASLEDDDALIFILGDHQPRHPLSDMHADPWWVPVHVLSRNPDRVAPFAELGYVEGLRPPELGLEDPASAPDGFDHFINHLFHAHARQKDPSARRR
jgi:hypothetical protein